MDAITDQSFSYKSVIREICRFDWSSLNRDELSATAWAYYYFSVQFRENLQIAFAQHPDDEQLASLVREECDTDNLSPWPEVAGPNEKLNHDEFMRRVLGLSPIDETVQVAVQASGERYLQRIRQFDDATRAMSITSYEDGGLENVFTAMLQGLYWDTPLLAGFRHFLVKHIGFDSNPDGGHGAMIRHLAPDERICGLWIEFRDLLVAVVPRFV